MKLPEAFTSLEWVHIHESHDSRQTLEVAGVAAWCDCYPHAICLVLDTGLVMNDIGWLQNICLWFASVRDCVDDYLLLESERLFLGRRHNPEQDSTAWETSLQQQLQIVDWLIKQNTANNFAVSANLRK